MASRAWQVKDEISQVGGVSGWCWNGSRGGQGGEAKWRGPPPRLSEFPIASNCQWHESLGVAKPYSPCWLQGSTVIEAKVKTITKALDHVHNFVWVRMKAEFMLESIHCNGSNLRNQSYSNGQTARECNKWPELCRPCCLEGKTEGAVKLSWEPKRTESKLCTGELARRGDLVMAVTPLWQRRGVVPFAPMLNA